MGALELIVWDRDIIGRDYLGEVALPVQYWFQSEPLLFDDPMNEVCPEFNSSGGVGASLCAINYSYHHLSLSQCLWYPPV